MPSPKPDPTSKRQKRLNKKPVKGSSTKSDLFINPPDWVVDEHPNLGGRPTKLDDETLRKIMAAWSYDCTMEEAAGYAKISASTLQDWVAKYKWLSELRERLKDEPVIRARQTWVGSLTHDVKEAREYLYAKRSGEFKKRTELTGADGKGAFEGIMDAIVRAEGDDDGTGDSE